MNRTPAERWRAPADFVDAPAPDLFVSCCDSRFGGFFDSFSRDRLGLRRWARLVVPGGPVFLARAVPPHHTPGEGAAAQVLFLIDALSIENVHLIQHDLCAFYLQVVGATPENLRDRQIEDLRLGADRLAEARPHVSIHRWIAGVEADGVVFDAV